MPEERHAHLVVTRQVPSPPRRRGSGRGTPVQKRDDVYRHGQDLGRQLQGTEGVLAQRKPQHFDPGLLIRLSIQSGTISEDDLKSFGIELISEESNETLVVFVSEQAKTEFLTRLARFQEGMIGRGVSANVFHAIEGVGAWTREDRIGRSLKNCEWSEQELKVVDLELWPRDSSRANRREIEQTIEWFIQQEADVWDRLVTDSVVLMRVQVRGAVLNQILELETVRVVELPPQLHLESTEYDLGIPDLTVESLDHDNATAIAVLDSGVIGGHPLISETLAEEESFIDGIDPADDSGHGTAVSGFALYGDLEKCVTQRVFTPTLKLLSGKVLSGDGAEYDRKLIASQVIEAVNYFNGELGCRIFNISFGDAQQPYDGKHVKGLAVVLDELARKHNILFVVSAGNYRGSDTLPADWLADYPGYLFDQEARIIDPAPSLNSITVGSIARYDKDSYSTRYPRDINHQPIARVNELSPFTRTGPGPNRAIKPDLVDYGGNVSIDLRTGGEPRFNPVDPNIAEIALKHTYVGDRLFLPLIGTSFAAPKVAHIAGRLLNEYPDASANLVRALLLLHASHPENVQTLLEDVGESANEAAFYSYGYGQPDLNKTLYSLENCATLIAEESIDSNQSHFYEIPLPEDFLTVARCDRSIRVSLAHTPICRSTRKSYKGSNITFKIVLEDDLDILANRFRQGSDLDNISEFQGFSPGGQLRGRGSAMTSTKSIKMVSSNSSLINGKRLFVVITHQLKDWAEGLIEGPEPYALAVVLEDRGREDVRLYSQLRTRLRQRTRPRVRI